MRQTNEMIDAVQECYQALLTATTKWNEYRRIAGEVGIQTKPLPDVARAAQVCVEAAEMLTKRKEEIRAAVYGAGILQATIYSADGKRSRKAVLNRPDNVHPMPSMSRAAYNALVSILGSGVYTDAQFEIAVSDDFSKIAKTIPHK